MWQAERCAFSSDGWGEAVARLDGDWSQKVTSPVTSYRQEMDERLRRERERERNPLIHYRTLGQIVGTLYSRLYYGECRERTGCQCNKDGVSTSTQDGTSPSPSSKNESAQSGVIFRRSPFTPRERQRSRS